MFLFIIGGTFRICQYTQCLIIKVTEGIVVALKLVLPKEIKVTRHSIAEYAEALRERYLRASREERVRILDEFTQVTGLHPAKIGGRAK